MRTSMAGKALMFVIANAACTRVSPSENLTQLTLGVLTRNSGRCERTNTLRLSLLA